MYLDAAGGKLHSNGGFALKRELVACETAEQIRFTDARITNQHDLEKIIIAAGQREGSDGNHLQGIKQSQHHCRLQSILQRHN